MMHDAIMRTTLTLDPDVAERLRQEVIPGKTSLKQVVNDRLRIGLGLTTAEPSPPFKIRAHHSPYQPGVDPDKLNQLNDELEADAFLEKERRLNS